MPGNNNLIFQPANPKTLKLSRLWFYNAIFALGAAGLFALPPVILRKSSLDVANAQHIFDVALMVHVNMSVLIWLLSMTCLLFALKASTKYNFYSMAAAIVAILGTVLVALSPFMAKSVPYTNNYVPILHNIIFLTGISCFACGVLLQSAVTLLNFQFPIKLDMEGAASFGVHSAAFIILIAFLCFVLSYQALQKTSVEDLKTQYELLFWGGGHILQFAYIQGMIFAWFWVLAQIHLSIVQKPWQVLFAYCFGPVLVIASPFIYIEHNIDSYEFISFFTNQMRFALGIAPIIAMIMVVIALLKHKRHGDSKPARNALMFSVILFIAGGVIGLTIKGSNAIIPAHYHGSIVAATLAFMAFSYELLPLLKFAPARGRLAYMQPIIYGTGQLMHISGLAWMGGYGALRKAAASSDQVHTLYGKILFFSGGGLAIIGGFLFILVIVKSLLKKG